MSVSRPLALRASFLVSCAALAAAPLSVSAASAAGPTPDQVVQMSAFEVRTTAGVGYSPGNAASALKSDSSLMDLPNAVTVVTNDMIKDIGANNSSDTLAYAGVGLFYRGPSMEVRGSRITGPYVDDALASLTLGTEDDEDIDAYEVIKGPVQIFYPSASLGGTVLETTKKPLPGIRQFIVSASITSWGGTRDTFDFNGPIGDLGEGHLTYRVVGVYQGGPNAFRDVPNTHECIWPDVEYDWHNTTVIVAYDVMLIFALPGGTGWLTPSGDLYTGWNDRRIEGAPANDQDRSEQHDARLTITQKVSDNWQGKFFFWYQNNLRYGIAAFGSASSGWNAPVPQLTYTVRLDQAWAAAAVIQGDVIGKYNLGAMPAQSSFGFNFLDQLGLSEYWQGSPITIPGTAAALNAIVLPGQVPEPANPGTRSESYNENAYYMEQVDVIPNWVTVVGGFTFSKIESISDTNIAVPAPYLSKDTNTHDLMHRFAAILHLTRDLMLYATESTTFAASSGVNYFDSPLPPVLGKGDEVGIKTAFLNGRISSSVAFYNMTLTNQAILVPQPALNIAGLNYSTPIGTTRSRGWDCNLAVSPLPGLQIVAAGYDGTIEDQNGNPVSQTYDNQWDAFMRYDFDQASALRGLAFGGGVNRIGARYFNMSGITLPGNAALPLNASGVALFKVHEGTMANAFATYRLNRNWEFRVNCENLLDQAFPQGFQGIGIVDPADPRTYTVVATFKF